ncbi:MAG: GNAT family N-acetyltransferase [Bacteroidetes bacterium]|nr:GNAT family N-acetyltransferase [Bacteroidota bacterium]
MLKSKNLILRAIEPSDVEILYEWENSHELWHLSNTLTPVSRFVLEQYVMSSQQDIYTAKQLRLMIDKIEEGKPATIGSIDLFDFDPANKRAGIGVMIIKSQQMQGFASEALDLMIKYCFNTLHLHQIYCNIESDNTSSLNLFRKFGFQVVGTKRDWLSQKDMGKDELLLQLIDEN